MDLTPGEDQERSDKPAILRIPEYVFKTAAIVTAEPSVKARLPWFRRAVESAFMNGVEVGRRAGREDAARDIEALRVGGYVELDDALAAARGQQLPRKPWQIRAAATGGGPCPTCRKPFWTHVCLSCSPDYQTPGKGCVNCRNSGMDQTPCKPAVDSIASQHTQDGGER